MKAELGRLTKVLELERGQGCGDRAVIGGLEAFVNHWRSEAAGRVAAEVVARVVADLDGYSDLDGTARRLRVETVLRLLAATEATPPSDGPRQPSSPTRARQGASAPTASSRTRGDGDEISRPVVHLKGIGLKSAKRLEGLGITTVRDLLFHAPRRYDDFRAMRPIADLKPGEQATVVATVDSCARRRLPGGRDLLTVTLTDTTGRLRVRFFNQGYLEEQLSSGRQIVVSGTVEHWAGRLGFTSPAWEPLDGDLIHTGRLVPVYPLTKGLGQRWLRRRIRTAVDRFADGLADPLPPALRAAEDLVSLPEAVRAIHTPAEMEDVERARRRLAFDELLAFQLRARLQRRRRQAQPGIPLARAGAAVDEFAAALPFALTGAQERCLGEIAADLEAEVPMARLLQGDVGCGKTAVAAGAVAACVLSGHRAAVMAPTEILAEQHAAAFGDLLAPLGFRPLDAHGDGATIALLVGSLPAREKERLRAAARAGEVDVLIGTHALIQTGVEVPGLALAIVDEQHRFGVLQRAELGAKADGGRVPHQLVMTATPIPRTLSMVLDASLDQSVIDEMPPGRRPAETVLLGPSDRERAYQFIRHRVALGEQAFVVCPLVEAADGVEAEAAVVEHQRLAGEVYPDLAVGLVHGRMAPAEKEAAMRSFRSGEVKVLVATTVIEVGVDVPNATVMMVEDADRFGLAQLHQLRGRVGRGTAAGMCILLSGSADPRALRRLEAVAETADGLALAALDLELRGPGDFFGLRQAGEVDGLRFARVAPPDTLSQAARAAAAIVAADAGLADRCHAGLARLISASAAGPRPT